MDRKTRVAVVGTGVVGREVLGALHGLGHPGESVTVLGSERAEGGEVEYGDESLEIEKATPESFRGQAIVILAVPADVARTLAPAAQSAGAWVVDLSAAFREDPAVPLVLPAVNLAAVKGAFKGRIVSCASPVSGALLTMLEPVRAAVGLREVNVTALMGASSSGGRGVAALEKETADLLSGREGEESFFPHRLAFNLLPQVGALDESGASGEERTWAVEAAKVWAGQSELPFVSGTAIQVPSFFGHVMSVTVKLRAGASLEKVRELWRSSARLKLLDTPGEKVYPMPMLVTADEAIHVGRLRALPGSLDGFMAVAAVDNAARAALDAVEVAGALAARG